ncbi:6-bladed beta-propeller [candidate division KSB1 bacterium]
MKIVKLSLVFFYLSFSNSIAFQKKNISESPHITPNTLELFSLETSIANDGGNEYFIYHACDIAKDSKNNLYIIDYMDDDGFIKMFDKNGSFIRLLGNQGGGPTELDRPRKILINNNRIYVFQKFSGLKVLNNNWKYIDNYRFHRFDDEATVYYLNEHAYFYTYAMGQSFNVIKKLDLRTDSTTILYKYSEPENTGSGFYSPRTFALNSKGEFYLSKDSEKYLIEKYDEHGNHILSFGREYKRKPFSSETRKYFEENYGDYVKQGRRPPQPKFPAIIRKVLIDNHDLLWIITGEWKLDTYNETVICETIDIFTGEGKYLYSFESDYFGPISSLRNGKLFSVMYPDKETAEQNIRIFKIDYSNLLK